MMSDTIDTIEVHANVIMTTASLKAIVENTKKFTEPDEKGHYKVDTAEAVNRMISRYSTACFTAPVRIRNRYFGTYTI